MKKSLNSRSTITIHGLYLGKVISFILQRFSLMRSNVMIALKVVFSLERKKWMYGVLESCCWYF